jgi:YVTN family beta-propeller protein
MTREAHERFPLRAAGLTVALVISGALACAQSSTPALPNMGQDLTPLGTFVPLNPGLADNPDWLATHAVSSVVSPLGDILLVLTSGYNRIFTSPLPSIIPLLGAFNRADSPEHVFIYDLTTTTPSLKQVVPITNTYSGIVFDPSGLAFYVAGGPSDNVHIITLSASTGLWGEAQNSPLKLGHGPLGGLGLSATSGGLLPINEQVAVTPCAAGVAISTDGRTLVVANFGNDSITVFNRAYAASTNWSAGTEVDLRPGKSNPAQAGVPGGEYPFWVVVKGTGLTATAYVSSIRDREIDVVSLGRVPAVTARIPVKGQPNKMTLNKAQSLLYVAEDQSDTVDVIDTTKNTVLESIPVIASMLPSALMHYKGANPNSVILSPDETQLYVTNGNLNCVAVIALGGTNSNDHVVGLIPTGWYPNSVSFNWYPNTTKPFTSSDSVNMYVVNAKSPTGPNKDFCYGGYGPGPPAKNCMTVNEYNPQRTKAGLASFPLPGPTKVVGGVPTIVAWDRDFLKGKLQEQELALFAQDDRGNLWNFGEYPEEYENGKFAGAPDTWIRGAGARAVPLQDL